MIEPLNNEFFDFISLHLKDDPNHLRLSIKKGKYNFNSELAITQIECRQKFTSKLEPFISNPYFLFPDYLSGEQATHSAVAAYHANLVDGLSSILDMTAGLGIDSLTLAKNNSKVISLELSEYKAKILELNAKILGFENLSVYNKDSVEYLRNTSETFDLIFIDPARRNMNNKRVYNLHDCSPDVIEIQDLLLQKAPKVIIKASPLLDITQTVRDFKNIKAIKAVGVKGECKEILIELGKDLSNDQIDISAVNLDNYGRVLYEFTDSYKLSEENTNKNISFALIGNLEKGSFLLEPGAMTMKLSPWRKLCENFNAKKLDKSSHLFISLNQPENFPGRVTKFVKPLNKSDLKNLKDFQATVISKNYPLTSDEFRKKFKLKEGDKFFIYATRMEGQPVVLLTEMIQKR